MSDKAPGEHVIYRLKGGAAGFATTLSSKPAVSPVVSAWPDHWFVLRPLLCFLAGGKWCWPPQKRSMMLRQVYEDNP